MAASPSPSYLGPTIASRYTIRRKLGAGSLGTVYLADDARAGRSVALKVLRTDRVSSKAVLRLQREFRAIASLHHPQIARAHDFGYTERGGLPFYTREYVEGTPLPPGPPLGVSPGTFLQPILDLLDALHYLHTHDVLHLDIHAGNLILGDDARRGSVLIDIGLVRSARDSLAAGRQTERTDLPPEMFFEGRASAATDIFLAGKLLLYRLCGRTEGEVRLPGEIPGWGPRLTLELERIADKAVKPSLEQRFQTAYEFREAVASALGETGKPSSSVEPRDVTVGRDPELRAIEDRLRRVGNGKPSVLWFTGPPGRGKTRLLKEVRLRAQIQGLDVIETRFLPDLAVSSHTLSGAIRAGGAAGAEEASWLEPLSPEHGGSPAERARRSALAYLTGDGSPLVLLLDDFELADGESSLLVNALIAESTRGIASRRAIGLFIASTEAPPASRMRSGVRRLEPLAALQSRRLLEILVSPLAVPGKLLKEAVGRARGSPLKLIQIARGLNDTWSRAGAVPSTAVLPAAQEESPLSLSEIPGGDDLSVQRTVETLVVLRRPLSRRELIAATDLPERKVTRALRFLEKTEVVTRHRRGRAACFVLERALASEQILRKVSRARMRRMHERMIRLLEIDPNPTPSLRENLAWHLLQAERRTEGARAALLAARDLAGRSLFDRSVRLLKEALSRQASPVWRLRLAEQISEIYEETGDHEEGVLLMSQFSEEELGRLRPRVALRVRRRLGVHLHRAGAPEKALEMFRRVQSEAEPGRDIEELLIVDAEMAELCTFRGDYGPAEDACRRGLERLKKLRETPERFRGRMELILRASLGLLELRRMQLEPARAALRAALKLASRFGATAARAVILNNLGILENQLNHFAQARSYFRRAERLLIRAGERRAVIETACNLAILEAKLGHADQARIHVERAAELLRHYPGQRLEFFVPFARGVVAGLLGEPAACVEALEEALPVGRKLGDRHLVQFAGVYLSEAHLASGRYTEARRQLRIALRRAGDNAPVLLRRMVHSRSFFLEALLGRPVAGRRALRAFEALEPTSVDLLEAWNALFVGFGRLLSADAHGDAPLSDEFERALRTFRRLRVPYGEAFSLAGSLAEAVKRGDSAQARKLGEEFRSLPIRSHRVLAVLAPLLLAEACAARGSFDEAKDLLAEAGSAIVGQPLLELDWWLEYLRARLDRRSGDIEGARRHLHRSLHSRDLLLQFVPPECRKAFVSHPRFSGLRDAAAWLQRLGAAPTGSTERVLRSGRFHGLVGTSAAMLRVFETVTRLSRQEMPMVILGETGTGKELVARAVHATSPRSSERFLALHCASLPAELFEAELFGYEAGAFTGAEESREGLLESLAGGTLLLDAVDELPLTAQAKLLRVLESGVARPVGSLEERPVDVRFLACSTSDLAGVIESGTFRRDIYYRLRGGEIRVPALGERLDDVPLLARHFLREHAVRLERPVPVLTADGLELLVRHNWPGNVRELETVLLRAVLALSHQAAIDARMLGPFLPPAAVPRREALFDSDKLAGRSLDELRRELDRAYIVRLFKDSGGDLSEVMKQLGVKRSRLYVLFKKLGIDVIALRKEFGRQ